MTDSSIPINRSYATDMEEIDLSSLLETHTIEASVPVRIDFGGSWDLKGPALMAPELPPVSVNIAIALRTRVKLLPHTPGMVKVSATGFSHAEYPLSAVDLTCPLGLVLAVLLHFQVSGVHVLIESKSPPRSGLGGSGAIAVAVIGAVSQALWHKEKRPPITGADLVLLAHNIESGLEISLTGMQDQAAAAFGGINLYQWDYRNIEAPFVRTSLLSKTHAEKISQHLLMACLDERPDLGQPTITEQELSGFLSNTTRRKWYALHRACMAFAASLADRNWTEAAHHLRHGTAIRLTMTPHIAHEDSLEMIRAAEECGCGAAFAGDGKRVLWAIGPVKGISMLKERWQTMMEHTGRKLLPCKVDFQGLVIS